MKTRSLILVHDGSYKEDLDPDRCSAAYIIMCKATGHRLQGTVVEKSPHASNYRAELLGALCCLLIVKAAADSGSHKGKYDRYCDNKGVVIHCNKLQKLRPDKQV